MGKFLIAAIFIFFWKTLAITENIPFNESSIKKSYKLTNGDIIFIEQYERGNRIWKKDMKTKTYNQVAFIWNFISLAKNCEGIKEKNIYFAQNLEYWLGGGAKIDDPQIRIFSLKDPSPWRDSDLGIVPNMNWAKQQCSFYKEIN